MFKLFRGMRANSRRFKVAATALATTGVCAVAAASVTNAYDPYEYSRSEVNTEYLEKTRPDLVSFTARLRSSGHISTQVMVLRDISETRGSSSLRPTTVATDWYFFKISRPDGIAVLLSEDDLNREEEFTQAVIAHELGHQVIIETYPEIHNNPYTWPEFVKEQGPKMKHLTLETDSENKLKVTATLTFSLTQPIQLIAEYTQLAYRRKLFLDKANAHFQQREFRADVEGARLLGDANQTIAELEACKHWRFDFLHWAANRTIGTTHPTFQERINHLNTTFFPNKRVPLFWGGLGVTPQHLPGDDLATDTAEYCIGL